jgi:hypothetical protein
MNLNFQKGLNKENIMNLIENGFKVLMDMILML